MNETTPITTATEDEAKALDLNTYREFLSRISGVSPVDTDNEIVGTGDESPSEPIVMPNSFISYQCYMKSVSPDNTDAALKGFTPEDIFEPENVFVTGMIDAVCPEFTKFSFAFDTETEEGHKSFDMMKSAIQAFEDKRMDIASVNVNEFIPFFFCEIQSQDFTIRCDFCNPLLYRFQKEIIEVLVPTSLVTFAVED